jgi:hypothetical protein
MRFMKRARVAWSGKNRIEKVFDPHGYQIEEESICHDMAGLSSGRRAVVHLSGKTGKDLDQPLAGTKIAMNHLAP